MPIQFKDAVDYGFVWRNNGLNPDQTDAEQTDKVERISMEDALSHSDAPRFFPTTVENIVRESIEPYLVGTNFLTRLSYKAGQLISIPSVMGGMYAADIDEGMEYPERSLNFGPGLKIADIGKSGLAFKITEEMRRYSQYDIVGMLLREAAKAMARHKEQKIWNMISKHGIVTHDNLTPANSVFGTTTGRGITGAANGSLLLDNIYEAYGQVLLNGFNVNTIVIHPLTFTMFMTDPVMRSVCLATGNMSQWVNGPAGFLNKDPFAKGALGARGPVTTSGTHPNALSGNYTALNQYNFNGTGGGFNLPGYGGVSLNIQVSPHVPYNPVSRLTDIYMFEAGSIGALIVDEEVTMDEVPDKLRDITKVKLRERYMIAPLNDGKAGCVIKNVKVVANEIALPARAIGPTISTALNRESAVQ